MPSHRTLRIVRHSPEAMFDLVADIERYPEFVPLCEGLSVRERRHEGAIEIVMASMQAGYGPIHESFLSRVRIDRPALRIEVSHIEGPFRKLENRWSFKPHPSGSEVEFLIDYEFRSLALQMLMGAMFDKAYGKYVSAFEARADQIYQRQVAPAADA